MKTYKITLTDNTDLVFNVYVEAPNVESACASIATAGLFIANVEW